MKRAIKNTVLTILFFTLGISTAFLIYLHFFASGDKDLSGEWTANLDMTEQAAVKALIWLQDIEAVSVSMEDMESYMQGLTIRVSLTFEQTGRFAGTFRSQVSPESYDACKQAAYEGFAEAFKDLLIERLDMAGYTGSMDEEAIEALVTETFGMSTVSYLMSCGPDLLPSLEELQDQYDGSGAYEAAEGILTRTFGEGGPVSVKAECYIRKDDTLVLSEETGAVSDRSCFDHYPMVYTLQQPQKQ